MKTLLTILLFTAIQVKGQTGKTDSAHIYKGYTGSSYYQVNSPKSIVRFINYSSIPDYPAGYYYGIDSMDAIIFKWKDNSDTIYIKAGVHIIRIPSGNQNK